MVNFNKMIIFVPKLIYQQSFKTSKIE